MSYRRKHVWFQIKETECFSLSLVQGGTQALNSSMPNQWARSAINVYTDTSTQSINTKPMGTISYHCLHRHKLTNMNNKPMGMILSLFIKTGNNYSLAENSRESLYQLTLFLQFILELCLNSVITSYALLYIT